MAQAVSLEMTMCPSASSEGPSPKYGPQRSVGCRLEEGELSCRAGEVSRCRTTSSDLFCRDASVDRASPPSGGLWGSSPRTSPCRDPHGVGAEDREKRALCWLIAFLPRRESVDGLKALSPLSSQCVSGRCAASRTT